MFLPRHNIIPQHNRDIICQMRMSIANVKLFPVKTSIARVGLLKIRPRPHPLFINPSPVE